MGRRIVITAAATAVIVPVQLGLIFALATTTGYVVPAVWVGTSVLVGLLIRGWLYEPGERHCGRWTIGLLVFGEFALVVLLWFASARFSDRRRLRPQLH